MRKNTVDDLLVWNNYIDLVVCYVVELLFSVDHFDAKYSVHGMIIAFKHTSQWFFGN